MIRTSLLAMIGVAVLCGCQVTPVTECQDKITLHNLESQLSVDLAKQWLEKNPSDAGVRIALAEHFESVNRSDEAMLQLEAAYPATALALGIRAREAAMRDKYARELLCQDPNDVRAKELLSIAYLAQGDATEAVTALRGAEIDGAASWSVWWNLSHAHAMAGNRDAALEYLGGAFEAFDGVLTPRPWWMWHYLAALYEGSEWPDAVARFTSRAPIPDGDTPSNHFGPFPDAPITIPPPDTLPALGVVGHPADDGGIRITLVEPFTIGAAANIRPGDTLLSIDTLAMDSLDDLKNWIVRGSIEESVALRIQRNGRDVLINAPLILESEADEALDSHLNSIKALVDAERWAEVADPLRAIVECNGAPNFPLLRCAVRAHLNAERHDTAIKLIDSWLYRYGAGYMYQFHLWRSYAYADRARSGASKASVGDWRKALSAIDRAIALKPQSGYLTAYRGYLHSMAPSVGMPVDSTLVERDFERALVLGHGNWALTDLAKRLDAFDTNERIERQNILNEIMLGFAYGTTIAMQSAGSSGSDPYTDSGQHTNDMYGPGVYSGSVVPSSLGN